MDSTRPTYFHTSYDALGNRVATKINDIWRYVGYDAFGKLVAEYGLASEGTGGAKRLEGLPDEKRCTYGLSLDGKQFAFTRGREVQDAVLISDFR